MVLISDGMSENDDEKQVFSLKKKIRFVTALDYETDQITEIAHLVRTFL